MFEKTIKKYIYLISSLLLFVSCESEEDVSDIGIFVKADIPETLVAGTYLELDITAYTSNEYIKEITISNFDADKGESIVYSKNPCTKKYIEEYIYKVPQVSKENTQVKIYITAVDNLGNKERYTLSIMVVGSDLQERSGIELHNPLSGKNDGLNTQTKCPIRKETLAATDEIYSFWLRQYTEEELSLSTEQMPIEWNTAIMDGKITFALNNSFNYAEATSSSMKSTYSASIKNNYINNLKIGDIVLVGVEGEAWGVIKILYIIDDDGVMNDKMIVNLKTID